MRVTRDVLKNEVVDWVTCFISYFFFINTLHMHFMSIFYDRLKGYFVDDQFSGEKPKAISSEPGSSVTGTAPTGASVAVMKESLK